MPYILICEDFKNSIPKREKNRNRHIEFLESNKDTIIFAGPMIGENNKPKGSLIIINVDKEKEAINFSKKDPYFLENLFEKVSIIKTKKVY